MASKKGHHPETPSTRPLLSLSRSQPMKPNTGKKATTSKRIVLGRTGRMELKRRFRDHPLRHMLPTSKPLSYWTTSECIQFARQLQIDYSDLVKSAPTSAVTSTPPETLSPESSPPAPTSPTASAVLPSLNRVPLSYRIQIFSNQGCVYLLELVNSTRVWELKQFLRKLYSQGLPQTQVLVYQKRVLADDQPLIAYFSEARYVQVQLSHWIHVRVRYMLLCDQWSETRTPVVDHSDASALLRGVCDQLGWNAESYQLVFNGTVLERDGGRTLAALGVGEDAELTLEFVAPPSPLALGLEDPLDFLSADPLLGVLAHPEMIASEFTAFLQDLDVSG